NWSNGLTTPNIVVNANFANTPNVYSVSVTDNCSLPNATAGFTVNVNPLPQFTFSPTSFKGCAPLEVNFQAGSTSTAYNGSGDTYFWNFGGIKGSGNTQFITYPTAGIYSFFVSATNSFGCYKDTTTEKVIEVYPVPFADFTPNPQSVTILEPNVQFNNLSQGASSYIWDFGDYSSLLNSSTATNPHHEYGVSGMYTVFMVATNNYGCRDTAIRLIEVQPEFAIYIPNAFTPDQNGRNDFFFPKGVGISEDKYKMEIFDRWGELIFTSNAFRTGWDGTVKGSGQIAKDDVYIYKIWVTDLEGRKKYYVGHVTLLKQ
ncbi:MAG: gliding motility-associated C-terminal domain-containing protein, partial [Bacteroidetes bacterium]|nr:gliding motility-associated C-terminal domain-containing protein [Bacteroidota bacterium]